MGGGIEILPCGTDGVGGNLSCFAMTGGSRVKISCSSGSKARMVEVSLHPAKKG